MEPFTPASTLATLTAAASLARLDSTGATLVRLGENAVFRLPHAKAVARVGRSARRAEDAVRELRVAHWLAGQDVPTAEPLTPEPIVIDDRVVTFWEEIPNPRPSTPGELGAALRRLHLLTPPDHLNLPRVEPMARVAERIAAAVAVTVAERAMLSDFAATAAADLKAATFDLPRGTVHGDGHVDNLVRGSDGRLAFVDLEECAVGQPEWDLVLTAIERDCGWLTDAQYAQFCDAYGYDVTTSPGYRPLRRVRLIRMTSWLAQKVDESEQVAAEVRHRIATLKADLDELGWSAY